MRVNPYFVTDLVSSLDTVQSNIQSLTSQLSSGERVTKLSDDPLAVGQNVLLLNKIKQDDDFTQSSSIVQGQMQVADAALGSVVTKLTSALQLATSANNGTMNSSNVKSIANELVGIRNEVLSYANTSYLGQYIFAGGQSSTQPFSLDSSTSPATVTYNGDTDVNYLDTPNGQSIQLNVPGSDIFTTSGANSVFKALNSLIADYSSGTVNTSTAVSDTADLNTALNYVSQQRVTIDNSLTQLTTATDTATNDALQMTTVQTNLMQADVPGIATSLSLSESQQSALESVIAMLNSSNTSLFSKLS
jgi:flagellar hook-associated protein 3 FlgL